MNLKDMGYDEKEIIKILEDVNDIFNGKSYSIILAVLFGFLETMLNNKGIDTIESRKIMVAINEMYQVPLKKVIRNHKEE